MIITSWDNIGSNVCLNKFILYIGVYLEEKDRVKGWVKELSELIYDIIKNYVFLQYYGFDDGTDTDVAITSLYTYIEKGIVTDVPIFNALSIVRSHRTYVFAHKLEEYIKTHKRNNTDITKGIIEKDLIEMVNDLQNKYVK